MLFNSIEFIFLFLPAAVVLHFYAARYGRLAAVTATSCSSLLFYSWWNPPFLLLPVTSILVNFCLARAILTDTPARAWYTMVAGICLNLAALVYFKYANFLLAAVENTSIVAQDVPLALSFTTFVQIAFLTEVWHARRRVQLADYTLFVSLFPHLIAGPIVRWNELSPQIKDPSRFKPNLDNIALGLTIFSLGLAKKVLLADSLSGHVGRVFDAAANGFPVTGAAAWGASVAYSLQLYFDFSGYSDMAVGIGLLFNFELPINFAAPLRATSIIELWRRWHITLSRFLRDFVYIPLGGNAYGPRRRGFNLFLTMVVGGLWHGANWTFIAWGALQGVLLIVNHSWRVILGDRKLPRWAGGIGWFLTFASFAVGMTLFRSANISSAAVMLKAMAFLDTASAEVVLGSTADSWGIEHGYISADFVRTWFGNTWTVVATITTAAVLMVALFIPDTMELVGYRVGEPHADWRRQHLLPKWHPSLGWALVVVGLFAVVFANLNSFSEFLYYQF
ncbi:D-alanyl-lipoteichoic acid acyltransferase DltB (MBOAT superfamily) [Bradyrhizobium sp. R2.2-H]|uniref:MBOAT family O-acyltransferase n=1 Tax=unclassified Bradyrhizobium TaxID=2631580 RepID=UPI00104CFD59|nr:MULTISPECIES: MBOAT family O-acyltransferase [unclassified Bradyrhizobium]TCU73962.1 D-alanyl-lipoteichoic acid acyltransferase DltB (MBOAT superfamily) [Bradyrhizobium sp. Y-H1]TCU75847.1 D-alanyl-lipoteichoic acid acyltransferase DltB (MBOAT superfamily) [Bradyrhizobium sp. R2.2-H]